MTRARRVLLACVAQLVLVGVAVAPSLSARVTGDEYRLEVAPVDPIDPFRGAYVDLGYPGLPDAASADGTVHVPLVPVPGTDLWTGGPALDDAPDDAPFVRCTSDGWRLRCGIESLFVPQDEALRLERELVGGGVARIRVDGRGNASVVAVEPR